MNQFMGYKPAENDYRIWLVINPSVWLMPILLTVLVVAIAVHQYAFTVPGQAWVSKYAKAAAPVAAAPAPVAAPAK